MSGLPPPASRPFPSDYSDKTVVVLGASRGTGAQTAIAFGRAGAHVVLASRDAKALAGVAEKISRSGGSASVVPTDMGDPASLRQLGEHIDADGNGLHVAFNNAGEGHVPTPLADVPPEAFERVLRVTVLGTFLALQMEIPRILRSGGGAIVNMSSTAGLTAFPGGGPYVTAKHAIIGLTKAAALDYAAKGLRVNAIAPGPIDTERLKAAPEEYRERARAAIPQRRLGDPSDVADVVLWLCSPRAGFVTGSTIPIEGGKMAGYA